MFLLLYPFMLEVFGNWRRKVVLYHKQGAAFVETLLSLCYRYCDWGIIDTLLDWEHMVELGIVWYECYIKCVLQV